MPPAPDNLEDVVPNVRRIAVLRANAIGDFVLTLPALQALRDTYPESHITLLGLPWHEAFLRGRESPVDEVVPLPPIPGLTAETHSKEPPQAQERCIAHLRRAGFDIALQWHGGGRYSNPFILALQPRLSAGFQAPGTAALDRNFPYVQPTADLHPRALLLLECAGLVGAHTGSVQPRLNLREADTRELHDALPGLDGALAVLQPGARDPRRRWKAEFFARVGDALAASGATVLIHGSQEEWKLAETVLAAMRQPALNIAGSLSPGGLCALLARSCLLVSNDTGPAHLARALGTPTVTIYWIGNLPSYGPLSAYKDRVFVSYRTQCPVCHADCIQGHCDHTASFVDDVAPDAVVEAALELFSDSAAPLYRLNSSHAASST